MAMDQHHLGRTSSYHRTQPSRRLPPHPWRLGPLHHQHPAANDLRWAAVAILWQIIFPFIVRRDFGAEARSASIDQAHSAVFWVCMLTACFRAGTPHWFRPSGVELFDPLIYPSASHRWIPLAYQAVSWSCILKGPKYLLIRAYMKCRRVDRLALYFKNLAVEGFIVYAIYFARRYEDHILRLFAKCLWLPVEQFLLNIILLTPFVLWYSPEGWSWRDYNPSFLQLFLRLLYYWQYDLRPRLRKEAIFDFVRDSEEEFEYSPFTNSESIRLLVLHRRHLRDVVNCTLFEVPLEKAPYYEAISYTWGDSPEMCNIRVNDKRLAISNSAYRVLKNRSSFWTPRVLWIDSICINQRDGDEKRSQIDQMREIYSSAFIVSVCLHPPEIPDDDMAEYIECALATDLADELLWTDLNFYANDKEIFDTYAPSIRRSRWVAFKNLMRNEWFNRVWVVQEVALATRVRVLYGKSEISWKNLVIALGICGSHMPFASLLETTQDPTASDARDKIFGIRGFCTVNDKRLNDRGKDDKYLISADYKKTTIQVYVDVARYIFAQEHPLRLLSYAGIGFFSRPSKAGKLPSWCPDWSRQALIRILSYEDPTTDYHAGGEEKGPPRIAGSDGFQSLLLRGRVIDTIKSLGNNGFLVSFDATSTWKAQDVLKVYQCAADSEGLVLSLPFRDKMYPHTSPPQPLREAYWRALCGDQKDKDRPAPASVAESYQKWLNVASILRMMNVFQKPWQPVTEAVHQMVGMGPDFALLMPNGAMGRRLCITRLGYIGFVPPLAAEGDVICLIQGGQVPFVMRAPKSLGTSCASRYELVGEAYVHGIIDGELV